MWFSAPDTNHSRMAPHKYHFLDNAVLPTPGCTPERVTHLQYEIVLWDASTEASALAEPSGTLWENF